MIEKWIWPDFVPEEFDCPGASGMEMNADFMDVLQGLRTMLDEPMVINSGFRTPVHNRRVGGKPGSYHLQGRAVDIRAFDGTFKAKLLHNVFNHPLICGIGIYDSWVHIDDRVGTRTVWTS